KSIPYVIKQSSGVLFNPVPLLLIWYVDMCNATLIAISGYGFIPSAFKIFYYRRNREVERLSG
ncbi:hypothetical protein ACV50N_004367, partial [Shigella flexneri]